MSLLDWIIPPRCIGCSALLAPDAGSVCPDCEADWRKSSQAICHGCGKGACACRCPIPLPKNEESRAMLHHIPKEGLAQAHLAIYEPGKDTAVRYALLRAKNKQLTAFDRYVGSRLALALRTEYDPKSPPVLTYCPRSPEKVARYGTDQARQIAKGLGRAMGLKVHSLIEHAGKRGADQKTKGADERFSGRIGHYRLAKRHGGIRGREIWLVDDIQTTGATLLFCAQLLYEAGAKRVLAVTVAKSVREHANEGTNPPRSHERGQKGRIQG